jgi:choline dehydrogenase-like flavoprotein
MADSLGTLTVSVQHPLSRGTVRALSADLLSRGGGGGKGGGMAGNVAADPRYCSHAGDCALLVEGVRFNSKIIGTEAMRELMPCPDMGLLPWDGEEEGSRSENGGDEEEEWEERVLRIVKRRVQTEFHPSGTTAMMPVELGGVVGPRLGVYGTVGLRVVDAGVMPLVVGAHLQAAVYAVAEKVCLSFLSFVLVPV